MTGRILVTGSAGHLGEALVRSVQGIDVVAVDREPSPLTTDVGNIADRDFVRRCMDGVEVVYHAATLHKPHVATHSRQAFVDTNVTGTLNLLEEAVRVGVGAFVFTSTTSAFGRALTPPAGAPAAWITEEVRPQPKNIYGVTKTAAEDLCELFFRLHALPCIVLRTSRFFPEEDDNAANRAAYADANLKANEYLHRRVEVEDVVTAHVLAAQRAADLGFGRYIISATTPFSAGTAARLRDDARRVVFELFPECAAEYERRGWTMYPSIERVYDNAKARRDLGWTPRWGFGRVLEHLRRDEDPRSDLARAIGSKGYHAQSFDEGPYPVD